MSFNLSEQIPPRAGRVVELGCGNGAVGRSFLRRQPAADYWGFEPDSSPAKAAATVLPHVFCQEPEGLDMAEMGLEKGTVDVLIVRGPFLRAMGSHLKDWAELLSEQGQLLALMPNAGYVRLVMEQLAGRATRLPCEGGGQSLAEAREAISAAGLSLLNIFPVYDAGGDKELKDSQEMADFLQAFVALCQRDGREVRTDIWAKGYLLKALRHPLPTEQGIMMHAALGEAVVTARVRVLEPFAFLATEPGVAGLAERGTYNEAADARFSQRVIIRQRLIYKNYEQACQIIAHMRKRGYLIVAEMDDNPMQWEAPGKSDRLDYAGAHVVQVSTEPLAERVRQENPEVHVFPNHLKELPEPRVYAEDAPTTVFFGALNRGREWQDIMPALNEAAAEYGERLRFKVLSDRGFFEALQTEHKEFVAVPGKDYDGQYVPYPIYQQALHSSDISLLPLHDTEFNRTKSDLKFIESAGHGAVALASPTVYAGTVRDGQTGFIYHDAREFALYLRLLVEDRERRLQVAEAAYRYVKEERLLSQHYMERLDWYRECLARREELDLALERRLASAAAAHRLRS
ncbi:MAG: glycosyltransferase [Desulfovibrio sp.]|nr:glycosyltransferase [Desulfovibrio sp.]